LSILRNRSRCCLVFWSFRDRVCLPAAASIDTILDGTSVVFIFRPNPLDKSFTEIGPDLGDGWAKWKCGVLANNSSIYCAPFLADHILKIDTIQGTVETLDNVRLPETGINLWRSGALAQDNHIYYMPFNARRIMRLNPDNDSLSSVGDDLGEDEAKYTGTVVGSDDCVYGIPNTATRIVKFDPANPDSTSTVGEEVKEGFYCGFECWHYILGCDGKIYSANRFGQVLQIDTTHGDYTWIGDPIYSDYRVEAGWGDPTIGADKCIYWPPSGANRVLKFDPETQQLPSLVGGHLEVEGRGKWLGGALASDGVIYCFPYAATQVLAIDPLEEMKMTLKSNFKKHPQELGRLFVKDEECNETFYDSAVRKFGIEKVFQLFEECLLKEAECWSGAHSNTLPLFMVAASCENSAVSVIYYFLRRNVHVLVANYSNEDSNIQNKKRKLDGN
jgi:hypothetical protein